ncbi:MAG TPA: hypothetical protein VMT29_18190 [Steroidobacteraceae bacterium]|nr:hypothetical protein [Steroidobacteraceae bacterium]
MRTRTYLVEAVEADNGYSPIVRLACLDDDAQGEVLEVVWDLELGREILDTESWKFPFRSAVEPKSPRAA